jgi:ferritin
MYTVKVVVMRKNQMKECVERTKEKSTKCTLSLSEVLKSWQKAIDGAIEQWLKWR